MSRMRKCLFLAGCGAALITIGSALTVHLAPPRRIRVVLSNQTTESVSHLVIRTHEGLTPLADLAPGKSHVILVSPASAKNVTFFYEDERGEEAVAGMSANDNDSDLLVGLMEITLFGPRGYQMRSEMTPMCQTYWNVMNPITQLFFRLGWDHNPLMPPDR